MHVLKGPSRKGQSKTHLILFLRGNVLLMSRHGNQHTKITHTKLLQLDSNHNSPMMLVSNNVIDVSWTLIGY